VSLMLVSAISLFLNFLCLLNMLSLSTLTRCHTFQVPGRHHHQLQRDETDREQAMQALEVEAENRLRRVAVSIQQRALVIMRGNFQAMKPLLESVGISIANYTVTEKQLAFYVLAFEAE